MNSVRKTISFTPQHDAWMKSRIATGDFTSDSEYVRDLIRKDQLENARQEALRVLMQEGIDSGVSSRSVEDIKRDVLERMLKNGTVSPEQTGR